MSRDNPVKFHYFSPVEGHVVARYGSAGYIGAVRDPKQGFSVDPDVVVRIPDIAHRANLKAYRRAVRDGSLVEKTEKDYDEYVERAAAKADAEAKERKAKVAENAASDGDSPAWAENAEPEPSTSSSNKKKRKKENDK